MISDACEVQRQGEVKRPGYTIAKRLERYEGQMPIPILLFQGERTVPHTRWFLHEDGKAAEAGPDGRLSRLVKEGDIWTFDPRGIGETSPGSTQGGKSHFGADSKEVFLSLHLGRPLLGMRVRDVLDMLPYVHGQTNVIAVGNLGPVALHAAALDPRIKSLTLENSLLSWSAVVRSPISVNQLTNVVPGVLQYYDLPDLAALIAPRPLTIKNPVDPTGKPVSQAELERVYAKAIAAYKKAGAADKLVLIGKK
jgi:pimeloyl-ACP methyl ester carboxylesterase